MGADQVIIAGGGIGGLGAALMLAQAGVQVRVLERAPEFKEVGAGLQLAPNITRMLDQVGVLEKILPSSVFPKRLVFRNARTAEELTTLDLEDAKHRYGGPYIVLHRSDLLDALREACEASENVTLVTDHEVTGVEDRDDHVVVRCTNGTEHTAQLLVGADGVKSVVRKVLVDDKPVPSGYVAYRGTVPIEEAQDIVAMEDVVVWMGPGMHLVQYPVRAGHLYNLVAVFRSKEYQEGKDDWGTPEELDATYSQQSAPVREAIPHLGRQFRWPMADLEPLDTWTTGRVTLLGDAAHAMLQYLAQGAGQSLLDGAALARVLGALGPGTWDGDELAAALRAYEAERVEAAAHVQRTARVWGDIWHVDDHVSEILRDEVFRDRDVHDYHLVDWLYGPVVEDTAAAPTSGADEVGADQDTDVPTPAHA